MILRQSKMEFKGQLCSTIESEMNTVDPAVASEVWLGYDLGG
jgi:hypothetical protein